MGPGKPPAASLSPDAAAAAVAALEKLGAKIERDRLLRGEPVVGVNLWEQEVDDADLAQLEALPDLRRLGISAARVTDAGMAYLARLTNLTALVLHPRSGVTDAGMAHLARLPRLQTLQLSWVGITDRGVEHLSNLPDLRTLSLVSTVPRSPNFTGITDRACEHLRALIRLESLTLMNADISSAGLAHLADLTNLTNLNLSANPRITDDGMEHLARLPRLAVLRLFSTGVSDGGLAHLGRLTSLEVLNLSGTEITDAGLAHLKGLVRLRSLTLGGEMIPTPSLGSTHVTDAGLIHLRALPSLESLWLDDSPSAARGARSVERRRSCSFWLGNRGRGAALFLDLVVLSAGGSGDVPLPLEEQD